MFKSPIKPDVVGSSDVSAAAAAKRPAESEEDASTVHEEEEEQSDTGGFSSSRNKQRPTRRSSRNRKATWRKQEQDNESSFHTQSPQGKRRTKKLIVYAAPRGTSQNPRAHDPGNAKYSQMIRESALEFQQANKPKRREIWHRIMEQFVFCEADGSPSKDSDVNNRLRVRLHNTEGLDHKQGDNNKPNLKQQSKSKTATKAKTSQIKTTPAKTTTLGDKRKRQASAQPKASPKGRLAVPITESDNLVQEEQQQEEEKKPAARPSPRKKAKTTNHDKQTATSKAAVVPQTEKLTVYGGRGNHSRTRGNVEYKKFLDVKRPDHVAGKQQRSEIVEECLRLFSFVSQDSHPLEHANAVEKIIRDLAPRPPKKKNADETLDAIEVPAAAAAAVKPSKVTIAASRQHATGKTAKSQSKQKENKRKAQSSHPKSIAASAAASTSAPKDPPNVTEHGHEGNVCATQDDTERHEGPSVASSSVDERTAKITTKREALSTLLAKRRSDASSTQEKDNLSERIQTEIDGLDEKLFNMIMEMDE